MISTEHFLFWWMLWTEHGNWTTWKNNGSYRGHAFGTFLNDSQILEVPTVLSTSKIVEANNADNHGETPTPWTQKWDTRNANQARTAENFSRKTSKKNKRREVQVIMRSMFATKKQAQGKSLTPPPIRKINRLHLTYCFSWSYIAPGSQHT